MSRCTIAVIAKAPRPGFSKTRLCPPLDFEQAAALAEAALRDTLAAVLATPATRRVLVLDGAPGAWLPEGFEVIAQTGDGLGERLAAAFEEIGGPVLLIGMDTPQVTPALLSAGLAALHAGEPSVLGHAPDGGYWAIGLQRPDRAVFEGVPMSEDSTGTVQAQRLHEIHGCAPFLLAPLVDVDHIGEALEVAALIPGSHFAAAVGRLSLTDRMAA